MEVPLMVLVALVPVCQAEVTFERGAKISTQVPQLEKLERWSLLVVDPTVMALDERAGDTLQAFCVALPAATTTATPALRMRVTALSVACAAPPPGPRLAQGWTRAVRPPQA